MLIDEYEKEVTRTCGAKLESERLMLSALGISGEAGEIADDIKKFFFHTHDLPKLHLAEELGDLLWYLTLMSHTLGFTLGEIMAANIEKLQKRYPQGFDAERSKNREPAP